MQWIVCLKNSNAKKDIKEIEALNKSSILEFVISIYIKWQAFFNIILQDHYSELARVLGVAINPADLVGDFPGVRGIEYSFDGIEFKDKPVVVS